MFAGQCNCSKAFGFCHDCRADGIFRVSGSADTEQDISFTPVSENLLRIDKIRGGIIGIGREQCGLLCQRNGRQRILQMIGYQMSFFRIQILQLFAETVFNRTGKQKTFHQFPDDMRSIRSTASVAADQQLTVCLITMDETVSGV